MEDLEAKQETFAKIIEGRVNHDEQRVQVCLKGTIEGFPATLEAVGAGWPFGCNYFIETKVIEDPNEPQDNRALTMTFLPRVARGFFRIFARLLLVEAKGQSVGDRRLEKSFVISYNNTEEAERFAQYPGLYDKLTHLYHVSNFSELLVRAGAGLWLSQPTNFKSLNADVYRETFKALGDLGQILFEAF